MARELTRTDVIAVSNGKEIDVVACPYCGSLAVLSIGALGQTVETCEGCGDGPRKPSGSPQKPRRRGGQQDVAQPARIRKKSS